MKYLIFFFFVWCFLSAFSLLSPPFLNQQEQGKWTLLSPTAQRIMPLLFSVKTFQFLRSWINPRQSRKGIYVLILLK